MKLSIATLAAAVTFAAGSAFAFHCPADMAKIDGALAKNPKLTDAQMAEVNLDRGPASELYLRKRPPVPEAPVLAPELEKMLNATVKQRDAKRVEAIALLREFLAGKPEGSVRADGQFKLAELLWEDSRRIYLVNMDKYERALERCKVEPDR